MQAWYTLYTQPKAEYYVTNTLQHRGLQVYLPELIEPDGKRPRPFFPRYLFVNVDFQLTAVSRIRWTPGLRHILTFGDRPHPVPQAVIDNIQQNLNVLNRHNAAGSHDFQPGDTVLITDGPFQEMLAIFEGPTSPSKRVQVLLKVLGGRRLQVEASALKMVESAPADYPAPKRPRRTRGQGRRINNIEAQLQT